MPAAGVGEDPLPRDSEIIDRALRNTFFGALKKSPYYTARFLVIF